MGCRDGKVGWGEDGNGDGTLPRWLLGGGFGGSGDLEQEVKGEKAPAWGRGGQEVAAGSGRAPRVTSLLCKAGETEAHPADQSGEQESHRRPRPAGDRRRPAAATTQSLRLGICF